MFEEVFRVFDRDNDGLIDKSDLQNILRNLGDNSIADNDPVEEMLQVVDENGDGMITMPEFVRLMTKEVEKAEKSSKKDAR